MELNDCYVEAMGLQLPNWDFKFGTRRGKSGDRFALTVGGSEYKLHVRSWSQIFSTYPRI